MVDLYNDDYFKDRNNTDKRRIKTFELEKKFIFKFIKEGKLLDVGCGTGELHQNINWKGDIYGIEVNKKAIEKAKLNKVIFDSSILDKNDFFDIIIFRGTIQHLENPFEYIKKSSLILKKNGYLFFLSTPNCNSLYYKLWKTLPMLDPLRNFWIPSDFTLKNVCKNEGFEFVDIDYPYISSPYANFVKDHFFFFLKLFGVNIKFPFWHNIMNVVFIKKK